MLENLKEYFAKKELKRLIYRISIVKTTSFKNRLRSNKNIMIIYPNDKRVEHEINNSLQFFFNTFPDSEFILIKPFTIPKEEKKFSGFPKSHYFSEYRSKKIDLLLDLGESFDRLNTYLSAAIPAGVKVRFHNSEIGDEVFHISISNRQHSYMDKLRIFKDYIDKLQVVSI
jgi:hypothetical protein